MGRVPFCPHWNKHLLGYVFIFLHTCFCQSLGLTHLSVPHSSASDQGIPLPQCSPHGPKVGKWNGFRGLSYGTYGGTALH